MATERRPICPRLIDYLVVVGARSPSRQCSVQPPELLRRYPPDEHADFPLPLDVVCFCQPEGCVTVGPKKTVLREATSFVFALTNKDSGKSDLSVCLFVCLSVCLCVCVSVCLSVPIVFACQCCGEWLRWMVFCALRRLEMVLDVIAFNLLKRLNVSGLQFTANTFIGVFTFSESAVSF